MSVQIVFETHSISTDNERGVATGWLHGELSQRGRELARELGRRRRDDGIAVVFASDLRRAAETAAIAFGDSHVPVLLDWRLRECDYGDLNGGAAGAVARERRHRIHQPFPGGESYRDAVSRVASFLDDLRVRFDSRRTVVIGHAATRWALEHLLEGVPLEELVDAPFEWRPGWEYVARD
jgi:2,3-bisphosphoglycerate-dependent phosphoglycerate mutase